MTTILILVAALAPLVGTAMGARAGTGVARACVVSTGIAATAALALLGMAAADAGGVPAGLADLPGAVALGLDRTSALLLLAVVGIALVVASFSSRSLDATHHRSRSYFLALGAVTTGSALVVIPGGPIPLLAGWVLSGRALVQLTRGWTDRADERAAQRRLVTSVGVGELALAAAVAIAVGAAGPDIVSGAPDAVDELATSTLLGIDAGALVAVLVVLAGAARSALLPFHRWLVATLYAPTPVSALVHAGFVSGAGLLLIRFAPVYVRVDAAVALAIILATATIVIGVVASLSRTDAKGTLAWSTVAQMAFMVLQCAIGAFGAAVFHILGHGMYKAAQFLGVGDTVAAGLRSRRRPFRTRQLPAGARAVAIVVIATAAVTLGSLIGPDRLDQDERVLLLAFAWFAVASGVHGVLRSRSMGPALALTTASLGAVVAASGYFVAIDLTKRFLEPTFGGTDVSVNVFAVVAVIAVIALTAAVALLPGTRGDTWRAQLRWWVARVTEVRAPLDSQALGVARSQPAFRAPAIDDVVEIVDSQGRAGTARLQAQVSRAAEIIAPSWPLSSFVAVNPLGGLETKGFEDAAADARRWLGGRTHRSLAQFRDEHERGLTTSSDLTFATHDLAMVACSQPSVSAPGRVIDAVEIVLADLLHGPDAPAEPEPRTALERRMGVGAGETLGIDDLVAEWLSSHVSPPPLPLEAHRESLMGVARRQAIRHARRHLDERAVAWLEELPDDSAIVLDASLRICCDRQADRIDEIRGHLVALPGWTGLARWRTDWAHPTESMPPLRPIDIAAPRAMLEAAVLLTLEPLGEAADGHAATGDGPTTGLMHDELLDTRVDAVIEYLDLPEIVDTRVAVRSVLALVPDSMRAAIWQRAQEHRYQTRLLTGLAHTEPRPQRATPVAQVALCIDVRSEGLRRHLEDQGRDETIGFAGFFGVPMQVRELGWPEPEPRCPVLVAPSVSAIEQPLVDQIADASRQLGREGLRGTAATAHAETKHVPGAAFAAAEALGWVLGPVAAWRTLIRPQQRQPRAAAATTVTMSDAMGIEQRVFSAESVLRTMGLSSGFADLVVLCGHTSTTVNNAHATALECGACAGASGASNARAVASLLNQSDVRAGLASRGIEIPDETWFTGAVHDTANDRVTLLDRHLVPPSLHQAVEALQQRLDRAGELRAAERAAELPGADDAVDVQRRGLDWAQVRPEWGLARNAAFVIGPRSLTAGLDLDGRAFLHSYDAANDPDGKILETIMTAPLVVGHWISAQYYFATVDPERFGAGDKLLHNPLGAIGVMTGAGGDLRVGLPIQSTHVADRAHHQPLRLLAVIEADPEIVESIIARNEVLKRLVRGSWLHIAARPAPGTAFSTRSPHGTWSQLPTAAGHCLGTN